MKNKTLTIITGVFVAGVLVCRSGFAELAGGASASHDDSAGRAMMQAAQTMIASYHAGATPATNHLRVIYFVPKDGEPFTNYEARLDRIVSDVSNFYRDGLRRFGIKSDGLPLERNHGKLVIHLVRGELSADQYGYNSGDRTAREIRQALQGTMDTAREHLLVFYALCRRTNDGQYIFNAPYYGGGSQRFGICHAADCELLDPLRLTDTNHTIIYAEHYYPRQEQTVARFNSWYLGGVAHELGHALSLPHDDGGIAEKSFGVSLMGAGNLTYREEVWGGGPPTYLGRSSALQLLSQPLISGSNRGRWDATESDFRSLNFSATNGTLKIQGVVTGAIPPYAVIAYVWHDDDHRALTFPGLVTDDAFTLNVDSVCKSDMHHFHLKLVRLHVNGATDTEKLTLNYDTNAVPDVATLNATWLVDRAEYAVMQHGSDAQTFLSDAAIAAAPTPEARRKLELLHTVLNPVAPFDLANVAGDSAWLSDAAWTDAKVGWGQVARNFFWFDQNIQNGIFLTLAGRLYDKGLYAHASARYVFPVAGRWKNFSAIIGLRDGAGAQGSAVFTVRGDGREIYRSRMLRVGESETVKVDIAQVQSLELLSEGGEGHNHNSWAIWAEPKVQR